MNNKPQHEKVAFDRYVVKYYSNKIDSCRSRGIAFNLTFTQVKNMLRAKYCQYTGVELTLKPSGNTEQGRTDVTIERIDSNKPYETGNVCAVSFAANQAKASFDRIYGELAVPVLLAMSKNISKRMKK